MKRLIKFSFQLFFVSALAMATSCGGGKTGNGGSKSKSVVIGEQEQEDGTLSVTSREKGDEGKHQKEEFIQRLLLENSTRYNYHAHIVKGDK